MSQVSGFDPPSVAQLIDGEIGALPAKNTQSIRRIRKHWSRRLRGYSPEYVLAVARDLHDWFGRRWVAYELIRYHRTALEAIDEAAVVSFGRGMDSWGRVDAWAGLLAGPAWMRGRVSDSLVRSWAKSNDRWWRRAALVCTVVLNTPSHGGKGDTPRTLEICRMLVDDRDDMVVKALSWALRKLSVSDPDAVVSFLDTYDRQLPARVKREVRNKLETCLKNPRRSAS